MSEPNNRDLSLPAFLARCAALGSQELNTLIRADQSVRWQRGQPEPVERYLELAPRLAEQSNVLVGLIYTDFLIREPNDLVLLDFSIPGLNGYQVLVFFNP